MVSLGKIAVVSSGETKKKKQIYRRVFDKAPEIMKRYIDEGTVNLDLKGLGIPACLHARRYHVFFALSMDVRSSHTKENQSKTSFDPLNY